MYVVGENQILDPLAYICCKCSIEGDKRQKKKLCKGQLEREFQQAFLVCTRNECIELVANAVKE